MTKFIIANWKMNQLKKDALKYCEEIKNSPLIADNLILAPSDIYLGFLAEKYGKHLKFAAQNITAQNSKFGPFTGETSPAMLKDFNVNYAIIGHYERRIYHSENSTHFNSMVKNCCDSDITPIICIGESEQHHFTGKTKEFLLTELESITKNIKGKFIVAYEPFWAIGQTMPPSFDYINNITEFIKNEAAKQLNLAGGFQLVYGGAVNIDNSKEIASIAHLDGLMLGRTSLDFNTVQEIFAKLI